MEAEPPQRVAASEERTVTVVVDSLTIGSEHQRILATAAKHRVSVGGMTAKKRRRLTRTTVMDVTVSGHPRRIREFHDDVRGNPWPDGMSGGPGLADMAVGLVLDVVIAEAVIPGYRAARRKWQGRNDPPLEDDSEVDRGADTSNVETSSLGPVAQCEGDG
jgi:hypothetical protein